MSRLAVVVVLALGLIACTHATPDGGAFIFNSESGGVGIISDGHHVASTVFPPEGGILTFGPSGHDHDRYKRGSSSAASSSSSGGGSSSAAAASSSG